MEHTQLSQLGSLLEAKASLGVCSSVLFEGSANPSTGSCCDRGCTEHLLTSAGEQSPRRCPLTGGSVWRL